jgi:hypothetical protein
MWNVKFDMFRKDHESGLHQAVNNTDAHNNECEGPKLSDPRLQAPWSGNGTLAAKIESKLVESSYEKSWQPPVLQK